jgi:hypothetical protein
MAYPSSRTSTHQKNPEQHQQPGVLSSAVCSAFWPPSRRRHRHHCAEAGTLSFPQDDHAPWEGRQDAIWRASPHAEARLRIQAGKPGRGHSQPATLPRPQEHPAHGAIFRAIARAVSRFLEGLSEGGDHAVGAITFAFKVRPVTSRTLLLGGVPIVQTTPRPPDSRPCNAVTSVTGRVTAQGVTGPGSLKARDANDDEIKRLSEMPADSIAAATTKNGTSARPAGSASTRRSPMENDSEMGDPDDCVPKASSDDARIRARDPEGRPVSLGLGPIWFCLSEQCADQELPMGVRVQISQYTDRTVREETS